MKMRALALIVVLAVGGCFKVEEPACAFACGPDDACPDNYECRSDGYCHKKGSTAPCNFSDAALAPDLSVGDLATIDQSMSMNVIDMAMSVPPDMTQADM